MLNSANRPVSTGKLLGGLPAGQTYLNSPDGTDGIGTWAAVKKQAAEKLGLLLVDKDVLNVPMIATDPYGKFIPGPLRGLPQYVRKNGTLVEGNLASPVPVPANVRLLRHAVPDGHRAQRRSEPADGPAQPATDHRSDAGRRQHAVGGLRQSARRHLRRRDAERALRLR